MLRMIVRLSRRSRVLLIFTEALVRWPMDGIIDWAWWQFGMRSNPYGSGVMENALQSRIAMAGADPRQRGLFAAAWAVGAVTATEGTRCRHWPYRP